jgi:hypothetical protein
MCDTEGARARCSVRGELTERTRRRLIRSVPDIAGPALPDLRTQPADVVVNHSEG